MAAEAKQAASNLFLHHMLISSPHTLATDPAYITKLAVPSVQSDIVAAASSDFAVKLVNIDHATGHLRPIGELKGHVSGIHDLAFIRERADLLTSASEDGTLALWDTRTGKPAGLFKGPNQMPLFCTTNNGAVLVAGSENTSLIWDIRTSRPLGAITEMHTDDVTSMKFHPNHPDQLYTSSEDGLINMHKLESGVALDDTLDTVFNIESPIYKFGFFGANLEFVYCLTNQHTLSMWRIEEADRLANIEEVRTPLANMCGGPVNYLVDCVWESSTSRLLLLAGDDDGAGRLFALAPDSVVHVANMQGHRSVIRDIVVSGSRLVTGAEDSQLCVWGSQPPAQPFVMPQMPPLPVPASNDSEADGADDAAMDGDS